ncbi:hypothetical protein NUACC21_47690 [Scytonema sp. NUACC21]
MSEIKNSYAVIIGINQYTEPSWKLKSATNDARKLAEILRDKYQYEVLQLVDEQATAKTLNELFTAFENQTIPFPNGNRRVEPDDRVLFYFAGHGVARRVDEKDDGPQGFIFPQDASRDDKSLLPMRQLHDALVKLGCRHLLIILDCCFAGSFRSAVRQAVLSEEDLYLERYNRYIAGCAQEVITSAAYNETAADSLYSFGERGEDERHSPFASTLFEALEPDSENNADYNKDGVVTITEIIQYIEQKFLEMNSGQTPGYTQLKKHDFGKYIFVIPGFDANKILQKAPLPDEKNPRYPYKGLLSFEREDKDKFFGRKRLIKTLAQKVSTETLSIVSGASGSGKSSLVKAGLVPELESATQSDFKILEPTRPGESPLTALARVCNDIENPVLQAKKTELRRKALSTDTEHFTGLVGNLALVHPNKKFLLVIDQLEELVTLCRDEKERKQFLEQLAKAVIKYRNKLCIVVTLRSDYEPVLRSLFQSAFQDYAKVDLVKARFEVTPMTREELREAIVEPAERIALFFEGATQDYEISLVDRLIDEVINMPGGLSLLSFTLNELYRKFYRNVREYEQYNRVITHKDYEELGKATGSLTRRADEIYQKLVSQHKDYDKIIKNVMLRMVAEGSGDLARRRVFMKELEYPKAVQSKVDEVIREFTEARLLVKGRDEKGNEYVEPAHDALVRGWSQLRDWLEPTQKREDLIENLITIQRRLTPAAEEWEREKSINFDWRTNPRNWAKYFREKYRKENFLWDNNPYLDVLEKVLHSPDNWYNKLETQFVRSSIQRRKTKQWIRRGSFFAVFSMVLAFAFVQWSENRDARTGKLAAMSEISFNSNKQLEALSDALKAGKQLEIPIGIAANTKLETMSALQQAAYWTRERNRLLGHKNTIRSVSFSPNGQILASASTDNTIKLWDLKGKILHNIEKHKDIVNSVSFSPNGQIFASGSYDKTIKLWSIHGKLLDDKQVHQAQVYSVSFSPDGKMLASASWDGTVKLWSVKDNKLTFIKTVELPNEILEAKAKDKNQSSGSPKPYSFFGVSFTPDGNLIAAGNDDKTVRIWNSKGQLLKTLPQEHSDRVYGVSFSPDGKTLASFSADSTIILWNIQQGKKIRTLTGHKFEVFSTSFTVDGKILISGSNDNTIKFWRVEDGKELKTLAGHSSAVRTVNISPDGKLLASAGIDSTIKLWRIQGDDVITLAGHSQKLYTVSISGDSKTVATAGSDFTFVDKEKFYKIKLWRKLDGKELRTLLGHQIDITATSFSPDSQLLASGDTRGNIIFWNPENGEKLTTLKAHDDTIRSLSFSPDSKMLASASYDRTIKLWNRKGELLATFPKQKNGVLSISFSPDGKMLASGSTKSIKLWNVEKRQEINVLEGHIAPVNSVNFSSDGKILASGSEDRMVIIWNILDGKISYKLRGHGEGVNSVSFLPKSDILASASSDKTIRLWNVKERKGISTFKGHTDPVYGVSFSPDGKTLASVSSDSTALLWNTELLDLNRALARGCQLVKDARNHLFWLNNGVRDVCDNISEPL